MCGEEDESHDQFFCACSYVRDLRRLRMSNFAYDTLATILTWKLIELLRFAGKVLL